jgi:hypothetical protein
MRFDPPGFLADAPLKPWLVVGKGPSLDGFARFDEFTCLTLNHACRAVPSPAVCFFMDFEAFTECLADIPRTARIVLPWRPHVRMRPAGRTLADLGVDAALGARIGVFNATTCTTHAPDPRFPVIRVVHFSGDGAVNLLAHYGVRSLHTIGIDGGRTYGKGFDRKDLLANGRPSFDSQFDGLERTAREFGMRIDRLSGRGVKGFWTALERLARQGARRVRGKAA